MIPPAAPGLRRSAMLQSANRQGIRIEKPEIFFAPRKSIPSPRFFRDILFLKGMVGLSYLFSILSLVLLLHARFLLESGR